MAEIKESRLLNIHDKIINAADLYRLAKAVHTEYLEQEGDDHILVEFSATCDDSSVFESKSPDIFSQESVLISKRIISVSMKFSSYTKDCYLDIDISHGDSRSYYGNRVKVSGTDTKWVNGTIKLIEEIIVSFTPQHTFTKKYKSLIELTFALSIGAIIMRLLILILSSVPEATSSSADSSTLNRLVEKFPIIGYMISYFMFWFIGWFPASSLMSKLEILWPSVEIQAGPEHKLLEKKRRLWMTNAIIIGVIPIVLQVLYDIARNLFKAISGYRDRSDPHRPPLPHHAAYGSVLRGSADQAESDPGEHKNK